MNKELIMKGSGLLTITLLLATFVMARFRLRFKLHPVVARLTVAAALAHAVLVFFLTR
jgi:hypothetical protein